MRLSKKIILIALLAVFTFSLFRIINVKSIEKREETAFEELRKSSEVQNLQKSESEEPQYTKYKNLHDENPDFVAWLSAPAIHIDYPVMWTPEQADYYIHRDFKGADSYAGTPFIGKHGDVDSDFFIIYGHNMLNGTMFSDLDSYQEADFYWDHPKFSLTTLTEEREYEIFSALQTKVPIEDGPAFYNYSGDLTEEEFEEIKGWLVENSLYETGVSPEYGEQILLLSTCAYHTEDGRFLMAARRVK